MDYQFLKIMGWNIVKEPFLCYQGCIKQKTNQQVG